MKKRFVTMAVALCGFGVLGAGVATAVAANSRVVAHDSSSGCSYSEGYSECCGSSYYEDCTTTTSTTTTTTGTTTTTTTTATTSTSTGPTAGQLNTRDRNDTNSDASKGLKLNLKKLAHGSVTVSTSAGTAGTLVEDYYVTIHGKKTLVATGTEKFNRAGKGKIKIKLTKAGKRLFKAGKKAKLTVKVTFKPKKHGLRKTTSSKSRTVKL